MLALVLDPAPRIVTDLPYPARGAGEALVRVRIAGVCDTDLQLARGYMGFRGVPGHEFVGEVVEEAEDPSWVGRRVVADINAGCGACDDCKSDLARGHHCPARTVLGILGRSGAFAERLSIPERCLVPVPDHVDDDRAVFAEPLAAALHVIDDARSARARRSAIVLGDGKLGQLIARALASADLPTTLVGHHPEKLALAAAAGISTALERDVGDAPIADVVVEATGTAGGLARALALVVPRGTVVLKTTVAGPITVDLAPAVIHEVRIVGSRCGDMTAAMRTLAEGRIDPRPLISARFPLSRADAALARAGERGVMKVLVDCQ